jgi:type IV conjugative transfer system protein TraE
MKYLLAKKKTLNLEYQRNTMLGLSAVLLATVLIQSICLLFRSERTIILPPEVKREFWAEGNRFSPEYLEEQAVYMAHLALDADKATFPYQTEILMRYADSEVCAHLRERFERRQKRLERNNASVRFDVSEATVYPESNRVKVSGNFTRFVGTKQTGGQQRSYEISFTVRRGRLQLRDIKRIGETGNETENEEND